MSTEVATANTGMEVTIHTGSGDVKLTPAIVRKYLVNGNGAVTDQEIALFLGLCKAQQLNPFVREAYLVKYPGNQPAAIIVAKETFLKRAYRSQNFKGHKAGIICHTPGEKELLYTQGVCPPGSKVVGGWAEVYTETWSFPLRVEVDFDEYVGKKSDGTTNRMWASKPATMIRKVALVQALREAFPDNYQGMYSEEEIPMQDDLPRNPVDTGQVIDVASRAQPTNGGSVSPQPQDEPQQSPPAEHRRRRNKFRVDPLIFGSDEILTCGCTADQLTELHEITRASAGAKEWISQLVKMTTGYDQWSFMREDEAASLILAAKKQFSIQDQSTDGNGNVSTDGGSEAPPSEQTIPDDLVECPLGDRVSVSQYCKTNCKERQAQGWCPVVDDPPEMAEGGML